MWFYTVSIVLTCWARRSMSHTLAPPSRYQSVEWLTACSSTCHKTPVHSYDSDAANRQISGYMYNQYECLRYNIVISMVLVHFQSACKAMIRCNDIFQKLLLTLWPSHEECRCTLSYLSVEGTEVCSTAVTVLPVLPFRCRLHYKHGVRFTQRRKLETCRDIEWHIFVAIIRYIWNWVLVIPIALISLLGENRVRRKKKY